MHQEAPEKQERDRIKFRLARDFSYHKPGGTQAERYVAIRDQARSLAEFIVDNSQPSREQSLAVTKLEEAVMWANAAIARNEVATAE